VAVERIVAGLEKKNRVLNPREREVGACHEMGHVPAGHRHHPQGVHHAARHRGAGLRHSAAHRRPLSHDRARLDVPGLLPSGWQPSQDTQQHIDAAVRQIVMTGFDRATTLLEEKRDLLERCARELLERETLDEQALRALTRQAPDISEKEEGDEP
jgi:ATP-dependent Zn protease